MRMANGGRVIDGFRIDITAEELTRHLETRIEHHHAAAVECDSTRSRVEAAAPPDEDEAEGDFVACWPGYLGELERRSARHRQSETALMFLRDHVVAREIYRLGERDLRLLELWPRRVGEIAEI
jgi:hypothetical protein